MHSTPQDHLAAPDGRSLSALCGVVLHCPELSVGWAMSP